MPRLSRLVLQTTCLVLVAQAFVGCRDFTVADPVPVPQESPPKLAGVTAASVDV